MLRFHTNTDVSDCQTHMVAFAASRADQQPTRTITNALHGISAVQQEIENDLLQLDTIRANDG